MFELPRLVGSEPISIVLQTRKGYDLPNLQELAPPASAVRRFELLLERHGRWELRVPPIGFYNCAGLVWASRRTSILEEAAWIRIRDDDGYREVAEEDARIGDLAVYTFADDNLSFLHVGLVIDLRPVLIDVGHAECPSRVPWVLSKLDTTLGEVTHAVRDLEFPGHWVVRYWTDRVES